MGQGCPRIPDRRHPEQGGNVPTHRRVDPLKTPERLGFFESYWSALAQFDAADLVSASIEQNLSPEGRVLPMPPGRSGPNPLA